MNLTLFSSYFLRWMIKAGCWLLMLGAIASCASRAVELDETAVEEIARQALHPRTSSGDRAPWQVTLIEQAGGAEIAENFDADSGKVVARRLYCVIYGLEGSGSSLEGETAGQGRLPSFSKTAPAGL